MSSISFDSPSGSARLSGSERAYMGVLVDRLGFGVLDVEHNRHALANAIVGRHEQSIKRNVDDARWAATFAATMRWGDNDELRAGEQTVPMWHLNLNTALTVGNDALRLCARLHAQCEIHAWVDGPHRAWLADIIEDGRAAEVLGADMGWEQVVVLLRSREDEPVVTSYSVTDGFPEPDPSAPYNEAWWDKPAADQWNEGMRWLRTDNRGLELTPESWSGSRFGVGMNVMQFLDRLRAERREEQPKVTA